MWFGRHRLGRKPLTHSEFLGLRRIPRFRHSSSKLCSPSGPLLRQAPRPCPADTILATPGRAGTCPDSALRSQRSSFAICSSSGARRTWRKKVIAEPSGAAPHRHTLRGHATAALGRWRTHAATAFGFGGGREGRRCLRCLRRSCFWAILKWENVARRARTPAMDPCHCVLDGAVIGVHC